MVEIPLGPSEQYVVDSLEKSIKDSIEGAEKLLEYLRSAEEVDFAELIRDPDWSNTMTKILQLMDKLPSNLAMASLPVIILSAKDRKEHAS